ncbi:hypothetical protein QU487_06265 [Crenobacter sp. SG2305]|uniref:hypothetical protein n=1 Tax=Crenobacter oryzisoli TaxID=3056844 RepID=UPI0025AA87B9|nr:hypothetical protein [Crenobacter sp. SG2305]MDN0082356.1 hypothetical protein [Crenobacter sp. SG2305]
MTMVFRERDGVCVEYEVRGIPGSEKYPYLNHIRTLKEAVAIARTYPGIYGDGAATHVVRRYSKQFPEGHEFHHSSGLTHRWRVDAEGRIQLVVYYRSDWRREKPARRLDLQAYMATLGTMPNPATTLRGELSDLARIAERIGLHDASRALREHVYGRRCLPGFGLGSEQAEPVVPPSKADPKPFWRRVIEKAMGH